MLSPEDFVTERGLGVVWVGSDQASSSYSPRREDIRILGFIRLVGRFGRNQSAFQFCLAAVVMSRVPTIPLSIFLCYDSPVWNRVIGTRRHVSKVLNLRNTVQAADILIKMNPALAHVVKKNNYHHKASQNQSFL